MEIRKQGVVKGTLDIRNSRLAKGQRNMVFRACTAKSHGTQRKHALNCMEKSKFSRLRGFKGQSSQAHFANQDGGSQETSARKSDDVLDFTKKENKRLRG